VFTKVIQVLQPRRDEHLDAGMRSAFPSSPTSSLPSCTNHQKSTPRFSSRCAEAKETYFEMPSLEETRLNDSIRTRGHVPPPAKYYPVSTEDTERDSFNTHRGTCRLSRTLLDWEESAQKLQLGSFVAQYPSISSPGCSV